jgi:NAD+-dependent farnesol dehydrogenase
MRVLVTGGSGYLGSAIARALSRAGHTPVIFARRASLSGLAGELVDGDVRDRGAVFNAARGVDAICHTAALVSVWRARPADFDDVNVAGFEGVLDVCRARHIPRLVYTSTFLALPPADGARAFAANDYQRTKIAAREIARRAGREGAPIVCLYPGVVYGPGAITDGNLVGRLVRDHLAGQLPGLVGASRPWSFTHVDDVAAAHVAALTNPSPEPEYVVGGDNAPPMRLFEILREVRNRPLPRRIPFAVAELLAVLEEARAALSGRPPLLTRGVVRIFRHDWSLDGRPAAASLGYTITSLDRGFRALLDGWGG